MPRLPRFNLPGIPQHVVQRGNNRQAIFFDDSDCFAYLEWLGQGARAYGVSVHAYVLMTNHVHLLLTPGVSGGIGRLMQFLGRHYVQHINHTYRRSGTLWEGRHKASVVQREHYFLVCQRYIELNPVRAKMVANPSDYPWSSYPFNALGEANALISPHEVYLALGAQRRSRCQAYQAFFEQPIDASAVESIRTALHHNHVLGGERFRAEIGRMMARRLGHAGPGRPRKRAREQADDKRQLDYLEN